MYQQGSLEQIGSEKEVLPPGEGANQLCCHIINQTQSVAFHVT